MCFLHQDRARQASGLKSKHRLLSVASASHCVVHVVGCTGRQRDAETQRTRRTQRRDAEKYTSGMSFALDIATLSKQLGKTHPLVCSPKRLLRRGGDARDASVMHGMRSTMHGTPKGCRDFTLLATTCISLASLPSWRSNTLALGSFLIASER